MRSILFSIFALLFLAASNPVNAKEPGEIARTLAQAKAATQSIAASDERVKAFEAQSAAINAAFKSKRIAVDADLAALTASYNAQCADGSGASRGIECLQAYATYNAAFDAKQAQFQQGVAQPAFQAMLALAAKIKVEKNASDKLRESAAPSLRILFKTFPNCKLGSADSAALVSAVNCFDEGWDRSKHRL